MPHDDAPAPHEPWLPTSAVVGQLPGASSTRTVKSLIVRGSRLPDGRILRLRAVTLNGRSFTRRSWVDQFLRELADASVPPPISPAPVQAKSENPAQQGLRLDAEQAELERMLGPLA